MKLKSFAVYVLCCFLLCNSVLADFESAVTCSDGGSESASGGVSVSSGSGSDSVVSVVEPSAPADLVVEASAPADLVVEPSAPAETDVTEGGLDEDFSVGEKVDEIVDTIPPLVDPSISEDSPGEFIPEVPPGGNSVYVLTQPDSEVVRDAIPIPVSIDDPGVIITDISLSSVAPVTPSSTSGLKAALLGILGNYDPVIVEYQYQSSQGYNNYLREIQPDYVWLCSAALLALVIYCLFKLGGGLIRG